MSTANDRRIALDIDHFVIRVRDIERTAEFYERVLGAERVALTYGRGGLRFGQTQINLHDKGSTPDPIPDVVPAPGGGDVCFRWDGSTDEALAYLAQHGIEAILGPVDRMGAGGRGRSVYFRDPDGNLLELISYE
jgi:catechol 2,3-dioxygenase-like lactoylglutathione lyase family enzyme